jgi:transposase-like protein
VEQDQENPRAARTKAERDGLLSELRASGKTVREFALEHGLPPSSVYQWVRTRREGESKRKAKKGKTGAKASKSSFTEVNVVGQLGATAASRTPAITVTLRCGHAVTFEGQRLDLAWLKSVLKVVSAC